MKITVETVVKAELNKVWGAWNNPEDIQQWNSASEDWHTPRSSVDLREGGRFVARMEAKDGSEGFERLSGVSDGQDRSYYAITVRPQVFINLVPDHVIVHRMFPMAPDRTIVECDWLYAEDVVAHGADLSRSVELFHRVNQQDFDACERCQPAMSSRHYANGGVLVPSEHHIGEFHRWVEETLASSEGDTRQ
jgi:phenylpropionate dioxygenase-like ring-hydroxylating dioxygenase large terminal subunit